MCVNCYQNLYTDTVTEFFALFKYSAVVHEKQSNSPSYQLIHGKYCLHHCFIDKSRLEGIFQLSLNIYLTLFTRIFPQKAYKIFMNICVK